MPPAPPPPPPSTNLPNFSTKTSSSTIPSGVPNTSALLKSIEKGTRLKKTTTNDRSAPLTSNQPNSTAPNKSNQNSATSIRAGNLAAPSGLGGLFANGFPALKSTKAPSSKATVEIPTILQKPLNKAVTRARESIARDPERAINIANQGIKMAAPVIIPELTSQKSKINPSLKIPASLSDLGQKMNVISELPRKMERQSGDRWNFPIESDDFLPSPRKFTGSKKIYLSQNSGSNDDGKSSSDTQISKADMSGFIKSLKSKLNKAASEENFEECVRLKTKLKSFQSIENRIKSGERVYLSELPR